MIVELPPWGQIWIHDCFANKMRLRANTIVILNKKNNQAHLLKETHVPGINNSATHLGTQQRMAVELVVL